MAGRLGAVAVALLALAVSARAFPSIWNTRAIGDGGFFVGQIVNPSLDFTLFRNCLVDVGYNSTEYSYGGWTPGIPSIDTCCVDRGFLRSGPSGLQCVYGCLPPNLPRRSDNFIANYYEVGSACITNCYEIDGCAGCTPYNKSCRDVCKTAGHLDGRCAFPDSKVATQCCTCVDVIA